MMAEILPFRGLRYDRHVVGDLARVMAPPYDVIDSSGQAELYERHPNNIIRVELGQQRPDDSDQDNRYSRAASYLKRWLEEGVLRREDEPAYYIYQHSFQHRNSTITRTGFLAAMRLEEWRKGVVLPHEATMSGPKMDRLRLMHATTSNCSPIFALYDDPRGLGRDTLERVVRTAPTLTVEDNGELHRLWVVTDHAILGNLSRVVAERPVYIADGHHRYETALFYRDEQRAAQPGYRGDEPWNFVMTLLVPVDDAGLLVLPTHRLVNPRFETGDISTELAGRFIAEPLPERADRSEAITGMLSELASRAQADKARGGQGHLFGVFAGAGAGSYGLRSGTFYLLEPRPGAIEDLLPLARAEAWRSLDVSVLHEAVLRRVFGLGEAEFENEAYVTYTRDEIAAVEAVDSGVYHLAIFLNPTPVRQVLAIARAGEVMPHKSTYFHPKPLTGMVINQLD